MMKQDHFKDMIGQTAVKRLLSEELIPAHHGGCPLPHILLIAPKGCGKTEMARCIARSLGKAGKIYNSGGIKNADQFFENIVIEKLHDQDFTAVFDECHLLPKKVQGLLLTMLNPNKEKGNMVTHGDYEAWIDFRRQSFVFATTDPQLVDKALKDRCKVIELEEYMQDEIADIVALHCDAVSDRSLLLDIASVCRGNARSAVTLSEDLARFLAKKKVMGEDHSVFDATDWGKFKFNYSILPLGISRKEMQVLKLIHEEQVISLGDIAFRVGDPPSVVRLETEAYLRKRELICIDDQSKRLLTAKGKLVMDNLPA